jgi:NTP pyrophosphatase (non-canonical NTP hydrolase)
LLNIANAERFNRERFRDDTEFADWAQSRCRHAATLPEAPLPATQRIEAVPVSVIEAEIAHIEENGQQVKELPGMTDEGRCRELCAMYLREFIINLRARGQLSALSETAPSGTAKVPEELTFTEFRRANAARCVKWHPAGITSWSPSDWLTAVTGELGELASLLKMRNRERDGLPGNKFSPTDKMVADEIADVLTYLDLLAEALGVDLGRAAVSKFNEVSERVGFPDRLAAAPSPSAKRLPTAADVKGILRDDYVPPSPYGNAERK